MQNRQRGAAHVPIMFFLILLVMFLGAVGYAYVVTDEHSTTRQRNEELTQANLEVNGKLLLATHYIEDIGRVFKMPGKYEPRQERLPDYQGQTLDDITGVMSPKEVENRLNTFGQNIQIAATSGLEDLLSATQSKIAQKDKRIADAEMARDAAMSEKSAVDAKFAQATTDHTNAVRQLTQANEQNRTDFQTQRDGMQNTISGLQTNVNELDDKLHEEQESRAVERKELQGEIGKLTMHNTALVNKDRLRQPMDMPDGRVIVARPSVPNAYISLGRKDMLQPGTIFRIRNRTGGGVKAHATVMRVEEDKAEVLVSDVVDPLGDPVREGDQIFNELYSPGDYNKRTIYLMGRFGYPFNKPQLAARLRDLGNTVVARMVPGVDTVILGDDLPTEDGDGFQKIEETEEYARALELGVEFAPLRKIRDLIKL